MKNIFSGAECTVYPSGDKLKGSYKTDLYDVLVNPLYCNQTIINELRKSPYGSDEQKTLKIKLTAATFSSVQKDDQRSEAGHLRHSGFIQFDIDGKDHPTMLQPGGLEKMKNFICHLPYTAYCGLSASGVSIWGLFKIKNPLLHSEHFEAMYKSFEKAGITLDRKPKNVASLRFICYDGQAYINENAQTFNLVYTPPAKPSSSKTVSNNNHDNMESKVLLKKFNSGCSFDLINDILLNAGWQYWRTVGDKIQYTRPGKKSGVSGDYHTTKRTFTTFSSSAPGINWMKENNSGTWSASPVTLLLNYECNGEWRKVFEYIKTYL